VLGCYLGFSELRRAGQIARLPRLWAAQPVHCGPIAAAALGQPPGPVRPTIAEGTAIAEPIRLPEVLHALQDTGGGAVLLTEAEIAEAVLHLAGTGIYVEPTCAQATAAYAKLLANGAVAPGDTTVLVLTGTGLKATPRIAELLGIEL
jgi:threonine synthase